MSPKSNCQECGRLVLSKKLFKSRIDGRYLCDICYKRENRERNGLKPNDEPIIPKIGNSTENKKKGTRKAKNGKNNSYIFRGEGDVIKKKYGKKYNEQISKLKRALGATRMKMITENQEVINREKSNKELNRRLVESLK